MSSLFQNSQETETELVLSNSMINDFTDYKSGEMCGKLFEGLWIKRNAQRKPSDVQVLGSYFEYRATGSIPRDGQVPEPVYLKRKSNGEFPMSAPYRTAEKQAEYFRQYCEVMGIKILDTNVKIQRNGIKGYLDIVAEDEGCLIIIDLKYTGNLYTAWGDYAWDLSRLEEKDRIMSQPEIYTYITENKYPFYFWAFSSVNEGECEYINVVVDDQVFERIEDQVPRMRQEIQAEADIFGFEPYPDLKRCRDCPLFERCEFRANAPVTKTVHRTW